MKNRVFSRCLGLVLGLSMAAEALGASGVTVYAAQRAKTAEEVYQSAYERILTCYRAKIRESESGLSKEQKALMDEIYVPLERYYAESDLNDDGIPELLIGDGARIRKVFTSTGEGEFPWTYESLAFPEENAEAKTVTTRDCILLWSGETYLSHDNILVSQIGHGTGYQDEVFLQLQKDGDLKILGESILASGDPVKSPAIRAMYSEDGLLPIQGDHFGVYPRDDGSTPELEPYMISLDDYDLIMDEYRESAEYASNDLLWRPICQEDGENISLDLQNLIQDLPDETKARFARILHAYCADKIKVKASDNVYTSFEDEDALPMFTIIQDQDDIDQRNFLLVGSSYDGRAAFDLAGVFGEETDLKDYRKNPIHYAVVSEYDAGKDKYFLSGMNERTLILKDFDSKGFVQSETIYFSEDGSSYTNEYDDDGGYIASFTNHISRDRVRKLADQYYHAPACSIRGYHLTDELIDELFEQN